MRANRKIESAKGYDAATLYYHLYFKLRCYECSPTEFQRIFEKIIKKSSRDFVAIRSYGRIGDRKCDGLFFSKGRVFQVYSPDELTQAKVVEKIASDLEGAVAHWKKELKHWTFVYNVRRGLPPDVARELMKRRRKYSRIKIDHMDNEDLWELIHKMNPQKRAEVLGPPIDEKGLFLGPSSFEGELSNFSRRACFVIVHDTMTPINPRTVIDALLPYKPFGGMLYVNPVPNSLPWDNAAKYQRQIVQAAIERSRGVLPRFAVFSLSQIALCIHLGFLLTDRLEVLYFQFDRDRKNWKWPMTTTDVDTNIRLKCLASSSTTDSRQAIIRISLSAKISRPETLKVVKGKPLEIDIEVNDPDVMSLKSSEQLFILSQRFREALKFIRNRLPNCSRIHLFYAGPTGGAIVVGQQINPRMNPPVQLYEHSAQGNPKHQPALLLK